MKYVPEYPRSGFASLEAARTWVAAFVQWKNFEHMHSGIGFVAPAARHDGHDVAILAARRHPERWSRNARSWSRPKTVFLNPDSTQNQTVEDGVAA